MWWGILQKLERVLQSTKECGQSRKIDVRQAGHDGFPLNLLIPGERVILRNFTETGDPILQELPAFPAAPVEGGDVLFRQE
jgi:hypothetical protein